MSAATGASKAVAEDWDKMITVTQNRWIICEACEGMAAKQRGFYNARMDKTRTSRRHSRRTVWWIAFAALAGFLLADLT